MEKDLSDLTTQIDYYFSDANLEYDEFFYCEIENNADGHVALDLILSCNKIKKMGVTYTDVQNAVEKSAQLELDKDRHFLKRKAPLPEFKGTRKQKFEMTTRLSRKNSEKSCSSAKVDIEEKEKYFVPLLFVITDVSELPKNGKLIEETIGEQ